MNKPCASLPLNPHTPSLLTVNDIEVIYDGAILAVAGVSLSVPKGAIVALLGANGAGKSTTLKAISGLVRAERAEVSRGVIEYAGTRPGRLSTPASACARAWCMYWRAAMCSAS